MAGESVDPSEMGNIEVAATSQQTSIPRQLSVSAVDGTIINAASQKLQEDLVKSEIANKLNPVYNQINDILASTANVKEEKLAGNEQRYQELKVEAEALKKSQEGMTGGAYKSITIGYEQYLKDVSDQRKVVAEYKEQLRQAQEKNDPYEVSRLIGNYKTEQRKLNELSKIDPWNNERYPVRKEEVRVIAPTYAAGYGEGGYFGYGEGSAERRDILAGRISGGTVGASTRDTRAAADLENYLKSGGELAPEITQDYINTKLEIFNKNPYSDELSQRDRIIISAFKQIEDPTSNYTTSGLAQIAQRLVDAGLTPSQAGAIVSIAPQGKGSVAYQDIMNILQQQDNMKQTLRATIMSQEEARKPTSPLTVNLGEMKKPFMSVIATSKMETSEKPAQKDMLSRVSDFFGGSPVGSRLTGKPESEDLKKFNRYVDLASPALMVGGSPKLPAGTVKGATSFLDTLFATKSPSLVKGGISTSAIIGGTLTPKGTEKVIPSTYESGKPAWTDLKLSTTVDKIVPLPAGAKQAVPLEKGLFSKEFFSAETPSRLRAGSLSPEKWTQVEQLGGGKDKGSYASFKAIPSDIQSAYEFKYDNNSRTGYAFIDKSGTFQVLVDSGIWKSSGSEASWNNLLQKGIDPLQTALNERGEAVKGTPADVAVFLQKHGRLIDVQDPAVLNRFYKNMEAKQDFITQMNVAKAADMDLIQRHRYEREKGIPVGTLSENMWKDIQAKQTSPVTLDTMNKKINILGADAYSNIKLNETSPYEGLQFKTDKSRTVSGILNSLDGSPLTEQQRKAITSEGKNLPIEDKVVLDKFLNIYEGQNRTYEKISNDLKTYNPEDTKSRAQVISDIQEYSKYSPQGAKDMLQMVKDLDISTQVQKGNTKVVQVSSEASPFAFNSVLKNGKLIPVDNTKTPLAKTLSEQQDLINKIKTPSIREQMQISLDESVQYGKINRELNNADLSSVKSFESMVNSLKLTPPEQKTALISQYKTFGEAKSLSDKADTLIEKAPKYGISDKELSDLKTQMAKNPVLTSVNEKTGKPYNEEIVSGLENIKAGVWTVSDYQKATGGLDIFTKINLEARAAAQQDVEARGPNVFNVGASAISGIGAAIPLTLYGTLRSFGIGGAAQEAQLQEGTKASIPTLGSMANLGDIIVAPRTEPFTKPFVAPARAIGGGIGYGVGLVYDIPASALEGRKFGDIGSGGRTYGSEVFATLASEPLEKPISGGVLPYLGGIRIGKVFGAISEYKTAKLIAPALERNAKKLTDIEEQLAATRGGIVKAGETKFPPATTRNPLARGGSAVVDEGASAEATRLALYSQEKAISRSTKMWKTADTVIDLGISAPFLVGMGADLWSTRENPTITGQKINNLIIMGGGASGVIGKTFMMEARLGEAGMGGSGWRAESIGLRTRMPLGEVENFYPAISLVASPTEGIRLPFTSKETGYSIQLGTPKLYSEVRDIQPARTAMSASDEAFYTMMVKDLAPDAAIKSEIPALSKTKKVTKTDALIQQVLKDLDRVDKRKYEKLPAGELEKIAEMSAKYKNIADFEGGVTPSGKIVPKEVNTGILSAEMVRQSKVFKDVNTLSPLGKQILYETILEANKGKASTPLSRSLVNAENKISGKPQTFDYAEVNLLPTKNERLFGEARLKTMNPLEAQVIQNFLKEREIRTVAKADLEAIRIQKRINERQAVINKLEDEVLRTGRAEISRQDIAYSGIEGLKPAKDGKFYITEKDLANVHERIAKEEIQLTWLSQVHEAAIETPWDKILSPELKGYKPQRGELERPFLMDQFGGDIKTEFFATPPMGNTPSSVRITRILPEFVMNKLSGFTERQYIANEAHVHPAEHPPSAYDVMQLFKYPSQVQLVEHSMVKTPNLNYYVVGRPKTIRTGGKRSESFTQPKVEAFSMMLQLGQNKILSEMASLKKGEPVAEGSWLAESGIKVFSEDTQERALQKNFFDQAFAFQVPTFKLSTEKKTGKVVLAEDYIGDLNTRLAKSLHRLQTLEDIKRKSVIGSEPVISEVGLALQKAKTPMRETRQIVEDRIPIDQRETFFRRQDIAKKPSKDVEKIGKSYYEAKPEERVVVPDVKGSRSPSTVPEVGKFYTEENPQKKAFEKEQEIYDKYLYKGFEGIARLHVLADRERFIKEGKIGEYYKTPLSEREGVIPQVKINSPKDVPLVGKYHEGYTYLTYKMGEKIPEEIRSKIPDDASFGLKDNPQRRIVVLQKGDPVAMASYRTPIMEGNALILDEIASFKKGSGRELIRTAEEVAREEGLTRIEAKPTKDVEGFYTKTGFKPAKGGVWEKPVSKITFERRDISAQPSAGMHMAEKTRIEAEQVVGALKRNNITDEYLKSVWKERKEQATMRPESEKIRLERQLQKDTSRVQLDHRKHILPAIKDMLDDRKVPNSDKVAKEIMKGLEEQDAVLYGSLIQDASVRLAKAEKLPYSPAITRKARDIDAHLRNPNIAAYKLTDMINKAAGDKVVEVKEGNPTFVKKYDKEQSKLFDLHDADAEGIAGDRGAYIGRGMVQPSRLTMTRKPLIMEGGSLKSITLSEQASRKFEGTGVFTEQPRKLTTEEGVSTAGSMIPEHEGRIKDIGDAWQIKQFQADLLEARGNPLKAEKIRKDADRWLDLYGESVAKDARAKAKQAKFDFMKDIGYDTRKQQFKVPSPAIAPAAAPRKYTPSQAPQQKYSLKISEPQKYNYRGYKSPSRAISASRSSIQSRLSSQYAPSVSKSMISPSISRMRSPSPSPSPYVSPSPSISPSISRSISRSVSPSVSPSKSPSTSPYRSPSRYSSPMSYEIPRITTPPFLLGGLGGGGGENEKRRRIVRRFKIRQPIATGYQVLTGIGLPDFTFNTANIAGGKQPAGVNMDLLKKLRRKANV